MALKAKIISILQNTTNPQVDVVVHYFDDTSSLNFDREFSFLNTISKADMLDAINQEGKLYQQTSTKVSSLKSEEKKEYPVS